MLYHRNHTKGEEQMSKQNKANAKNLILLLISVILTVAVCCAAVYAWFTTQSKATGKVSMGVNSYNFSVNGEKSGEFDISFGNFHPGVSYTYTLDFSNVGSNVSAVYDVYVSEFSVTASNNMNVFPDNMSWQLISSTYGTSDIKSAISTNSKLISGREIAAGDVHSYQLKCTWAAVDEASANTNDTDWQNWYKTNYGNDPITFKVKVDAKQKTN